MIRLKCNAIIVHYSYAICYLYMYMHVYTPVHVHIHVQVLLRSLKIILDTNLPANMIFITVAECISLHNMIHVCTHTLTNNML